MRILFLALIYLSFIISCSTKIGGIEAIDSEVSSSDESSSPLSQDESSTESSSIEPSSLSSSTQIDEQSKPQETDSSDESSSPSSDDSSEESSSVSSSQSSDVTAVMESSSEPEIESSSDSDNPDQLNIMTFNLWFKATWITSRRYIANDMIQEANPDIIGIQENWTDQGIGYPPTRDIVDSLTEYTSAAFEDRNDILYKKDLFTVVDSGTFSLGATAEGRHVAWALFKDTLDRQFYFYNTHWNYQDYGNDDWLGHGEVMAAAVRDRAHPDYPAIVTGDFNSNDEAGNTYFRGVHSTANNDYPFRDTWTDIHDTNTVYHSTKTIDKHGRVGEKLDYIFVPQDEWTTIDAEIIAYRSLDGCGPDQSEIYYEDGLGCAPSDHEPVVATIEFKN